MWAWLAIPLVRKTAEVVLLFAALGATVLEIYHRGKSAGQQAEQSSATEKNHAEFDLITKQFQIQLDAGKAREEQLATLAARFADVAATAGGRVQTAQQASRVDSTRIETMPDSAVKLDVEAKLGGSLADPAVLRHADQVITDYPHKVDEARASGEQVAALRSGLENAQEQTATIAGERDAAVSAYNAVLPLYAQAYNAAILGHRHWYCLWLCKPKRTIALPAPATLVRKP